VILVFLNVDCRGSERAAGFMKEKIHEEKVSKIVSLDAHRKKFYSPMNTLEWIMSNQDVEELIRKGL
jgi:hypothetical protein